MNSRPEKRAGVLYALAGFLVWGASPLYWHALAGVPVLESLCHRVVWSALFLALWLQHRGAWGDLRRAVADRATLASLGVTTLLIGFNWYVYIWAVQTGHVLESSLGYFMNPLVNVLLGLVFLKERLRPAQAAAIALAACAVVYLALALGKVPWIALSLAFSFGAYALLRKTSRADALVGLSVETFLLAAPAAAWLLRKGTVFLAVDRRTDLLLIGTVVVTALPLLWYTEGARRLSLKSIGVLQYLSPTCQFLIGAFVLGEPLAKERLTAFALIWIALALYTADAVRRYRGAVAVTSG